MTMGSAGSVPSQEQWPWVLQVQYLRTNNGHGLCGFSTFAGTLATGYAGSVPSQEWPRVLQFENPHRKNISGISILAGTIISGSGGCTAHKNNNSGLCRLSILAGTMATDDAGSVNPQEQWPWVLQFKNPHRKNISGFYRLSILAGTITSGSAGCVRHRNNNSGLRRLSTLAGTITRFCGLSTLTGTMTAGHADLVPREERERQAGIQAMTAVRCSSLTVEWSSSTCRLRLRLNFRKVISQNCR
jgi:hypothetical protein